MIATLALGGMATSLQFTLAVPVLPAMPDILDVNENDASWIVTVTLLTSTIVAPLVSRLADMFGKKRMLLASLVAMIVGSATVALAGTLAVALIGRGLQGCASGLIPIGISLLRDQLPPERVGSAVALMSATLGIGSALGMPLSGTLYAALGWRSVFFFSAVIGALLLVCVRVFVADSRLRSPGRFDVVGSVLFIGILTAALLTLSKGGTWDASVLLSLGVTCGVLLAIWIPHQLRTRSPVVDLRTLGQRPIVLTNIVSLLTTLAMFINMLITTRHVQAPVASGFGFGESIVVSGLAMLPAGIAMVAISPVSGALLNRFGGRPVLIVGSVLTAVALAFRVAFDDTLIEVMIGATLVGLGTALAYAAAPTLIMASVPASETAAANGLNSMVRHLGTALGSALIALLLTTTSISLDGADVLTPIGGHLALSIGALLAGVGAIVAVFVPRSEKNMR